MGMGKSRAGLFGAVNESLELVPMRLDLLFNSWIVHDPCGFEGIAEEVVATDVGIEEVEFAATKGRPIFFRAPRLPARHADGQRASLWRVWDHAFSLLR